MYSTVLSKVLRLIESKYYIVSIYCVFACILNHVEYYGSTVRVTTYNNYIIEKYSRIHTTVSSLQSPKKHTLSISQV